MRQTLIAEQCRQYKFFHWHFAFADVFADGGFDCVLGNPPWERVKLQEKEWFASRIHEIAEAPNAAARKHLIDKLPESDPAEYAAFLEERRKSEGESALLRNSGRYPLCGRGDVNTYSVFAELMRSLIKPGGRVGCIVPSGLATDDTLKHFFRDLIDSGTLASFYDFENRDAIFPGVHRGQKFALVTLKTDGIETISRTPADFAFFLHHAEELRDTERRFTLSADDLRLLNPNTRTSPIFRSRKDAELTKLIYRRVPVLWREATKDSPESNFWNVSFKTMFHMSNDSDLFHTKKQLDSDGWILTGNIFKRNEEEMLPLYEAKMIDQFDHRAANIVISERALTRQAQPDYLNDMQHRDPSLLAQPRYWVCGQKVQMKVRDSWNHKWFIGWRDITSSTNARSLISAVIPFSGIGHSFPVLTSHQPTQQLSCLNANLSSFICDFFARLKIGGLHATFFIMKQLCVLPPDVFSQLCPWAPHQSLASWISVRVLELVYTARDMTSFALELGYNGSPFTWDKERRAQIYAELNAVFFHLYLGSQNEWIDFASKELRRWFPTPRDVIPHIMDSFPIVRDKDLKEYGHYRTCETILTEYDRMAAAIAAGVPYESTLSPSPGQQGEDSLALRGSLSQAKLYIIFMLELFTLRPEIDKRTFRDLCTLIGNVFDEPDKILSYCVSPANDVSQYLDAIHALIQGERTTKLDDIIHALKKEKVIAEKSTYTPGLNFPEFREENPSIESIAWIVQELLRIVDRDAQLLGSEALMDSSVIADDAGVGVASRVNDEQAIDTFVNDLLSKG